MLNIKQLREEKSILQLDLAKHLGVSKTCISDWERERSQPSIEILMQIADYFECSIDYLVGRSNELDTVIIQNDISYEEKQMLFEFRKLETRMKARCIGYIFALQEQQKMI